MSPKWFLATYFESPAFAFPQLVDPMPHGPSRTVLPQPPLSSTWYLLLNGLLAKVMTNQFTDAFI